MLSVFIVSSQAGLLLFSTSQNIITLQNHKVVLLSFAVITKLRRYLTKLWWHVQLQWKLFTISKLWLLERYLNITMKQWRVGEWRHGTSAYRTFKSCSESGVVVSLHQAVAWLRVGRHQVVIIYWLLTAHVLPRHSKSGFLKIAEMKQKPSGKRFTTENLKF